VDVSDSALYERGGPWIGEISVTQQSASAVMTYATGRDVRWARHNNHMPTMKLHNINSSPPDHQKS
jgi:hypothetical protein